MTRLELQCRACGNRERIALAPMESRLLVVVLKALRCFACGADARQLAAWRQIRRRK